MKTLFTPNACYMIIEFVKCHSMHQCTRHTKSAENSLYYWQIRLLFCHRILIPTKKWPFSRRDKPFCHEAFAIMLEKMVFILSATTAHASCAVFCLPCWGCRGFCFEGTSCCTSLQCQAYAEGFWGSLNQEGDTALLLRHAVRMNQKSHLVLHWRAWASLHCYIYWSHS